MYNKISRFIAVFLCSLSLLQQVNTARKKQGAISDFFPDDLTTVTWAHGVNSQDQLQEALKSSLMMLEADIQMGLLEGSNSSTLIPIMAHPPAPISDLSFEDFLNQVIESNNAKALLSTPMQGIKLDFKQITAVEECLIILQTKQSASEINVPVWLNADILRGPVNSIGFPVHAETFLNLTTHYMPNSDLSIGWTTRYAADGKYTMEQVQEMAQVLKNQDNLSKNTHITFPLRTSIAIKSAEEIVHLLDSVSEWELTTITLWGGDDPIDMKLLISLIETVGKNRCFVDLPFKIESGGRNLGLSLFLMPIIVCLNIIKFL